MPMDASGDLMPRAACPLDAPAERTDWRDDWGIRATAAVLVWAALYCSWLALGWGGQVVETVFSFCYDTPILPLIAWLSWRVSRLPALTPRQQRGWRAMSLGFLLYFCGSCTWNVYEGILEVDPFPSLADAFFLPYYPLAIYAIVCLSERLPTPRDRAKFALDCATAMVSIVGALWYFALRHVELDSEHGLLGFAVSAAYPVADVMLLLAVVSAILKRRSAAFPLPLTLIAASCVAMTAGDLIFLVPALEDEYASGGLADLAFLASFVLMTAASALQYVLAAGGEQRSVGTQAGPYAFQVMPYLTVAGIYALLMWEIRGEFFEADGVLSTIAMVITGLVVARQIFANRENAELSALQAASVTEARYTSLVKNSSDLVLVVSDDARVTFVTPSIERLLGIPVEALPGKLLIEIVHPADVYDVRHFCRDLSEDPSLTGPVEWRLRTGDGDWTYVEVVGSNLLGDPTVSGLVLNARDITERKRLEDELKHLAFTDTLTLLANRNLFNEQLGIALTKASGREPYPTLIFADLDNFKKINDSLGHEAGDKLLAIAARRLIRATRSGDTVARLGGDEFALLITGDANDGYIQSLAGRLVDALSAPYDIDGRQLTLSASLGIARAERGITPQELMRNADLAMYRAKARGKRCFEVFEPAMYASVMQTVDLEMEMASALDRKEFVPFFQPIVDLRTSEIVGFEALVRWQHPVRGLLAPATFIQIAEDSGLIERLGRSMLEQACRHAVDWLQTIKPERLQHIAINISGRQIEHTDLVGEVRHVIEALRIPPQVLVLEITESVLMHNVPAAIDQLTRLKQLGVRIALDDFGTGYSSLSHVHRFPIDILKIDRSFIDSLKKNDGSELVRAIISLATALDLDVVAEGIEKVEQLAHLQRLGCTYGQGYYFGRPESADSTRQLLKSTARLPRLTLVPGEAAAAPARVNAV